MAIYIKPANRGKLHRELGIPQGERIPAVKLKKKATDSSALEKEKTFARNAKSWKH
jgi:hypothetical protein